MTAVGRFLVDRVGGGRNLRRRIAITVGAVTTALVLVFGVAAWVLAARSLEQATDDDLRGVASAVESAAELRAPNAFEVDDEIDDQLQGLPEGQDRPAFPYLEIIDPLGVQRVGELPVSDASRAVALGTRSEVFETIEADGRSIRMLTIDVGPELGEGAMRVGLDITNVVDGLRQARVATTVAGLLAGLAAAALAWLLAGRLIAPVTAVAEAADHLRRNDDLPDRLEGEGDDELGRLVVSFNALLDDLRQARDQQRRLVADASHELRTPLTSLRVKTEFIQSQPELPVGERQRMLDGAVADLSALSELVDELVELAAEGATPERARLVDVGQLVTETVDGFRLSSGRTVEVRTEPGVVETRSRQVARALTNLLGNAHKYSPEGEAIVVTQRGPRIEVRDHGPGIAAEDRDRVFDRFYRGKAHQSIDGSGLGLAIVASVARSNGGRIWVDDPADGGDGAVVGFSVGPTVSD
ncbi:MAG: HAMP domain-containing sensor histidine kinase [Actinomycetota bacterium]